MKKFSKTPEEYREIAKNNFLSGYNCAQAVIVTFADELGLDKDFAASLISPFGGGMGRLREVCGAVSGMLAVLGLLCGYSAPGNLEAKKELYAKVQHLAGEFTAKNGNIVCRNLLGLDIVGADSPVPEARTPEYYKKRPCPDYVGDAAYIIAKFAEENFC